MIHSNIDKLNKNLERIYSAKINTVEITMILQIYLIFLLQLLGILWWTLLVKIIDLIETILFVLRKKNNQISFLHTYHHLSTLIFVWLTLRHFTHCLFLTAIALNSSVHVIMYSYHFLSTLGPNMQQKVSPFKHWVPISQMVRLEIKSSICSLTLNIVFIKTGTSSIFYNEWYARFDAQLR